MFSLLSLFTDWQWLLCAKDDVNEWIDKMVETDGIILASPVYYGGISGTMKCFLDRAF